MITPASSNKHLRLRPLPAPRIIKLANGSYRIDDRDWAKFLQELSKSTDVTADVVGGTGLNYIPAIWATFIGSGVTALPPNSSTTTATRDNSWTQFGVGNLKTNGVGRCYFGASATDYKWPLVPSKSWIFSAYTKAANNNAAGKLVIKTATNTYTVSVTCHAVAGTVKRVYGTLDLSADASQTAVFAVDNDDGGNIFFDGLMLEPIDGNLSEPSAFSNTFTTDNALDLTNGPEEADAQHYDDKDTASLSDGGGLGNTADWNLVNNKPTTLAGFGITDAEPTLGSPTEDFDDGGYNDQWVLTKDTDGVVTWQRKLGWEFNSGDTGLTDTDGGTDTNWYQWGTEEIVMPYPEGRKVSILAFLSGDMVQAGTATSSETLQARIQISEDGGATYTNGNQIVMRPTTSGGGSKDAFGVQRMRQATPTDDVHIKAELRRSTSLTGTDAAGGRDAKLAVVILPMSVYSVSDNTDTTPVATVPSTLTATCKRSSAGSCTANGSATCTVAGGTPGYAYSWAKTAGDGSVSAGSTKATATFSNTETAADGAGTSETGTFVCTITDSDTPANTDASNNLVVTFKHKIVYDNLTATAPSTRTALCTAASGSCSASTTITATGAGGKTAYSYSWVKVSGNGSITGATSQTCTVDYSAAVADPAASSTGTFKCTLTDAQSPADTADTNNCVVTFKHLRVTTS